MEENKLPNETGQNQDKTGFKGWVEKKKTSAKTFFNPAKLKEDAKAAVASLSGKVKGLAKGVNPGKLKAIDPRKLFKKANIAIIFVILFVVLLISRGAVKVKEAVIGKQREMAKMAQMAPGAEQGGMEIIPVKVGKAKMVDSFKDYMPALGNVKGFKNLDLKFETSGIIEAFNFKEGESVYEGEIIANLDQREVLLKLRYSELELEKNEKLFEIGGITESKLEQAKLEYESNRVTLDKTNLYASRDGVLGTRDKEEGEYVTPSDRTATLLDISSVFCEFGIIEKDIRKVEFGQSVDVFVDALPDKQFSGVIDEIAPIVIGVSRTQAIKVRLENADEKLKPGMFARANITVYDKEGVLVIPANALNKKGDAYFVYTIEEEAGEIDVEDEFEEEEAAVEEKPQGGLAKFAEKFRKKSGYEEEAAGEEEDFGPRFGTAKITAVSVGYVKPDLVEITKGLIEGDMVAVDVHREIPDGARVQIEEAGEMGF